MTTMKQSVRLKVGTQREGFTPGRWYEATILHASSQPSVSWRIRNDSEGIEVFTVESYKRLFTTQPLPVETNQRAEEPALRYDGGKSRIDLIAPGFILRLGDHYKVGALKYAERNWENGMSYSRCYGSAQRHMLAFWAGEDVDAETGSRHVIAAAWNMAAIDYYMSDPELSKKFDDRTKKPA